MSFKFFRMAVVAVAASLLLSSVAAAQSTILVVDHARVLRDSAVGQHVGRQLESIANSMNSEVKASASPFVSERDRLVNELKAMDEAAIKARPDLQTRATEIMKKQQKLKVDTAYKQRELAITEQKALEKVNKKVSEILEAIAKERNADVILDRQLVYYGQPADITDIVISRLNSQMPSVSVVRERLPRTQPQK